MIREPEPRTALSLIKRVKCTSDETPPWDGIMFTQPVDSDKLAEDLKQAHSDCSTLRERKHMAAIDFLKIELRHIQARNAATNIDKLSEHFATPEACSLNADTSDAHSRQDSLSISRARASTTQHSTSEVRKSERDESSISFAPFFVPSNGTPAPQIVFSASDGRPLQLNTKRRMTKEEKVMYRKTRKRGACITCRRQKGKCTHIDDNSADPGCLEEAVKTHKRSLSLDFDMENDHMNKNRKTARPPGAHDTCPTPPLPPDHHGITNTSGTTNAFDCFEQPTSVPENTSWERGMDGDGQIDQYRYVKHRLLVDPYTVSTSYEPETTWREYPIATNMQQPYPEYVQLQVTDLPEGSAPLSPTANISPMDVPYQSALPDYLHEPWDGTKDHQPNGMDPG